MVSLAGIAVVKAQVMKEVGLCILNLSGHLHRFKVPVSLLLLSHLLIKADILHRFFLDVYLKVTEAKLGHSFVPPLELRLIVVCVRVS